MKGYYIKVYLTSKGLKTEKKEISIEKSKDGYLHKEKSHQFNWGTLDWEKREIEIGTIIINPNSFDKKIFDKVIIAESWCLKKDYNAKRLYLIECYESYIPLIKKNILEKEKEIRSETKKLINYKKGLNIFSKKTKKNHL